MRTNVWKEARTASTNNDVYDSHFYTLAKRAFLLFNIQFITLTIPNIYTYDISTCDIPFGNTTLMPSTER